MEGSSIPNDSRGADRVGVRTSRRVGSSRAVRLMERLIGRQLATTDGLSIVLRISRRRLRKYLEGKERMPLESQRRLADVVVELVPELAAEARRLRRQCDAEARFLARETTTHMVAPPLRFR